MNFLKLSLCLLLFVAFSSCGKDDDKPSCTQSDWVGTYEGTINCDGTTEVVTVTITANGSGTILISYETTNTFTGYDPLTPNSCNLDRTDSAAGFSVTINSMLSGDDLRLSETLISGTDTTQCDITAKRK